MEFQFPSNGKVYPKFNSDRSYWFRWSVSIPFKRESVSKGDPETRHLPNGNAFQFPSNGKVHGKTNAVAIVGKQDDFGFNSLQTGKFMES